jgi:hypothetical protein
VREQHPVERTDALLREQRAQVLVALGRPRVDERAVSVGGLEQRRIPLAHVDERDAQAVDDRTDRARRERRLLPLRLWVLRERSAVRRGVLPAIARTARPARGALFFGRRGDLGEDLFARHGGREHERDERERGAGSHRCP